MKNLFKKIILKILNLEAKFILKRNNPFIITVTGNLGKTSTKDFINLALKQNFLDDEGKSLVLSSKKSMNSEFGIPLTILGLESGWNSFSLWIKIIFVGLVKMFDKPYFKYLILEIGADAPNDIKNICTFIKPDMTIITGFAETPVHIEFFNHDRNLLIREKKYLVENLKDGGTFVYNLDDKDCQNIAEEMKNKNINFKTFSTTRKDADIFTENISEDFDFSNKKVLNLKGLEFDFVIKDSNYKNKVNIGGVIGDAIVYSCLPSLLIADILNLDLDKVVKDVEKSKRTNGRMRVLRGVYNTTLIDDTYNASPKAVAHGIDTVENLYKKIRSQGENIKKIFVLGDMLELGDFTKEEHEKIGEKVSKVADILITSGIRAKMIAKSAIQNGMNGENVYECSNSIESGRDLLRILEDEVEKEYKEGKTELEVGNYLIFIKGSQGARMERVTKMVLGENHDSNIDLVRQDKAWETR